MSKSNNGTNGEYIFITQDPHGREVRLKSSTWDMHVTGGDHNRTEFDGEEETVKKIIEDPYYIIDNKPDDPDSTRQKYLDFVVLDAFENIKNVTVVVDHEKEEYSDVVTVMAKSRVNDSTKGGAYYVRGKSTNQ